MTAHEPAAIAKGLTKAQRLTTDELIQRAREMVERMTPEEYATMIEAQRQSFIRAMAPCSHGDPDWETCPKCCAHLENSHD